MDLIYRLSSWKDYYNRDNSLENMERRVLRF